MHCSTPQDIHHSLSLLHCAVTVTTHWCSSPLLETPASPLTLQRNTMCLQFGTVHCAVICTGLSYMLMVNMHCSLHFGKMCNFVQQCAVICMLMCKVCNIVKPRWVQPNILGLNKAWLDIGQWYVGWSDNNSLGGASWIVFDIRPGPTPKFQLKCLKMWKPASYWFSKGLLN